MKQKLVRLELTIDFGCKPQLKSYHYEDEVLLTGKVYQNQTGIRNDKTTIRLGEIWMNYEDESNSPYWKSIVIVEETIDKEQLMETIESLYNTVKMLIKNSFDSFRYRYNNIKPLDEHDSLQVFRYGSLDDAKFRMNMEDFKDEIISNAKSIGESLSAQHNVEYENWEAYFDSQINSEFLDNLLRRFTVLKIQNNEVEFQVKQNYDMTIDAIAAKLANDLFFLYKNKNN